VKPTNVKTWRDAIIPTDSTISDAIVNLNQVAVKIVMVASEDGTLQGTVSDGDIRRALLQGLDLNSSIIKVMHKESLVVTADLDHVQVKQLMTVNRIHQIPVVDEDSKIIGLHLWDDFAITKPKSNIMVIMAGGKGTRLQPHTEVCPKPLLPISGKPMLEHIINRAKKEGFQTFIIAINHLGHMIEEYFGNGSQLGVKLEYVRETFPLGTAGALSLLDPKPSEPFLVTNGDVITDIRYGELLNFHIEHNATATMAVQLHEWQHAFGIVQIDGIDIINIEEKPVIRNFVNAGVYVVDPKALKLMEINTPCDMPALFKRLYAASQKTIVYPVHEQWLDVGRPSDYQKANSES
jgi:dTDP-glucose pyrophosphorylase